MAAPETQNPNDGNAPVFAGDTLLAGHSVLTEHDWVTYVLAFGTVLVIIGGSLLLLSNLWPYATMMLIGAICLTIACFVWVGLFGFFTWKVVETGRIAIPLLWRRIRQ